jgi:hypothetical protein
MGFADGWASNPRIDPADSENHHQETGEAGAKRPGERKIEDRVRVGQIGEMPHGRPGDVLGEPGLVHRAVAQVAEFFPADPE